jgi:hypothetical protein
VFSSARTLRDVLCSTLSLTNYYSGFIEVNPERLDQLRRAFRAMIDDLDQLEAQEAAGQESVHVYRKPSSIPSARLRPEKH